MTRLIRRNRHRDCFNQTVERFNITVASLCKQATIGESAMSRFRSGEADFLAGSLQDLIDAMEPVEQAFYYSLLMTTRPAEAKAFEDQIETPGTKSSRR